MKIITDTREKLPYWEDSCICLQVGDYTTAKLKNKFHIERKSPQDLYGTLTSGNNRFKHELFRAAYHGIKMEMFIETTYTNFINKKFPGGSERQFTTEGLIRLVSTFEKKYYLKFNWFASRELSKIAVFNTLKSKENEL